jgi:hypothetical protein
MIMTQSEYDNYCQSNYWMALAERTKRLRPCCESENCPLSEDQWGISREDSRSLFGRDLQVHHLHYDSLWFEHEDDLQVLCFQCHKDVHGISGVE